MRHWRVCLLFSLLIVFGVGLLLVMDYIGCKTINTGCVKLGPIVMIASCKCSQKYSMSLIAVHAVSYLTSFLRLPIFPRPDIVIFSYSFINTNLVSRSTKVVHNCLSYNIVLSRETFRRHKKYKLHDSIWFHINKCVSGMLIFKHYLNKL